MPKGRSLVAALVVAVLAVTVLPHQNASTRFPANTPMRPR